MNTHGVMVVVCDGDLLHQLDSCNEFVQPAELGKPVGVAVYNSNNLYNSDTENGCFLVLEQVQLNMTYL